MHINKRLTGHIVHLRSSALQETSFTKPTSVKKKKFKAITIKKNLLHVMISPLCERKGTQYKNQQNLKNCHFILIILLLFAHEVWYELISVIYKHPLCHVYLKFIVFSLFHYFLLFKMDLFFIWIILNLLNPVILYAKFNWKWPSGSLSVSKVFSLFCFHIFLPLERSFTLHLNQVESPPSKNALCQGLVVLKKRPNQ